MTDGPQYVNDEPIAEKSGDLLGWDEIVRDLVHGAIKCRPPYVFGIHGDWGSGKTSLMNLLYREFTNPEYNRKTYTRKGIPVFFEAWKYQYEPAPIVALLHEIRQQITWNTHFTTKLVDEAKEKGEVALRSALLSFEDITKKIGIQASKIVEQGEHWEKRHHATAIPSDVIRNLLDNSITKLIGRTKQNSRRLVIIIDDLDRCHHETAFQLLEGIKIYLNIESCVFFLGINQTEICRAIGANLKSEGTKDGPDEDEELAVRSREYLEKLCSYVWPLPIIDSENEREMLNKWIQGEDRGAVIDLLIDSEYYPCLPANPRRIKAYCNTISRILKKLPTLSLSREAPDSRLSLDEPGNIAAVVVAAYFQTYHQNISRILQREPRFYETIRRWVESPEPDQIAKLYPQLKGIVLPMSAQATGEQEATSRVRSLDSKFCDPAYGNILYIQKLIWREKTLNPAVLSALLRV